MVIVGMPASGVTASIDPGAIANDGQRILGSKMGSARIAVDIPKLVALYREGRLKLDELISGRYPLDADQRGDRRGRRRHRDPQRDRVLSRKDWQQHEDHRARDIRRRQPAARTSAAATSSSSSSSPTTGSRASARSTRRRSAPHVVARMIEDVFDAPRDRRRPVPRSSGSGATSTAGATRGGPTSRSSACSAGIEMACWDIVGKAVDKPVYELLGGQVHERLRGYTYLYPRAGRRDATSTSTPTSPPSGRRSTWQQGFTALKFDPAGPYTTFDPRQPGLEELERCERYVQDGARGGRRPLRPPVRHPRPVHAVRRDPPRQAARALRPALVRGADAARAAGGDGAGRARDVDPDRDRRAADDEVRVRPRARDAAPPRSCS